MNIAGKNVPNWAVYGGAGVVVVGGVLYLRNRSGGSGAGATDPSQIDPATGMTYADETAQYGSPAAAEQALAGQGGIAPSFGSGGVGGSGDAFGGAVGGGTTTVGSAYTSNAQWAQAVEAGLVSLGYDPAAVGAAIGKYLLSMPLTSDQVTIVQTAVAEFGPPPVGTFSITGDGGGGTGTGSGGGGTGTPLPGGGGTPPPVVGGKPITVTPAGLHVTHTYANSVQVAWNPPAVPAGQGPLTGYGCAVYDSGGHVVNGPFAVPPSQHYANFGGLKSKTSYHANIWCDPAKPGGPHATVPFKTL